MVGMMGKGIMRDTGADSPESCTKGKVSTHCSSAGRASISVSTSISIKGSTVVDLSEFKGK